MLLAAIVIVPIIVGVAFYVQGREAKCGELGGQYVGGVCIEGRIIPLE